MKKYIAVLAALLTLCILFAAQAEEEIPQFSGTLFSAGKQAVVYLASGEYERLVTLLPFSDIAPSATEWQNFAEGNYLTITSEFLPEDVQTEYSVAYWTGTDWLLAVPITIPETEDAEALVLSSADGLTFTGYRYALWTEIKEEYEQATYVTWNKEYIEAMPVITVD